MANLNQQKAALRNQIRVALKNISSAARTEASVQACARLKAQTLWQDAASVLFFAPLPEEVDVWPLLEETLGGRKVAALPCFDPKNQNYVARRVQNLRTEVTAGHFGIRQPDASCAEIPLNRLDLILTPGVAFDLRGHRLGRGKGFYDQLLHDIRGVKCGIAFEEQIVDEVPAGPRDIRMDFILTPARCATCG